MAVEIFVTADRGVLSPVSQSDQDAVLALPKGKTFVATVKQRRSNDQQRFYWAMLGLVVKATGRWPSPQVLHTAIKMQLGYFEPLVQPNGIIRVTERSTSFGAMDGLEFREYLDAAIDVILTDILVGTPRSEFVAEIEKMTKVDLTETV